MQVPRARVEDVWPIIDKPISTDKVIFTDQSNVYQTLNKTFTAHKIVNDRRKEYVRGAAHTNSIEGCWAHMKRGINGIYHQVSKQHLQ